jgi:hypothetical protein
MLRKRGWDDDEKPTPPENLGDEDDEVNYHATPCVGELGKRLTKLQEFTMGIMLKTLNIDLDLIGYDSERDCWK